LPAICLTADAVRSYRTFSPLPLDSANLTIGLARGGVFSVPLVLQVTLTGRYPAHCPAEFGLSSAAKKGRKRPLSADAIIWPTTALLSVYLSEGYLRSSVRSRLGGCAALPLPCGE